MNNLKLKKSKMLIKTDQCGTKRWYKNGVLHRIDGPAVIYKNETVVEYWFEGKPHRENGPAVQYKNGFLKQWYVNGKLHRKDGPAIEYAYGSKYWYYNGQHIICDNQQEFEKILILLVLL